jgi:hypothetical protein
LTEKQIKDAIEEILGDSRTSKIPLKKLWVILEKNHGASISLTELSDLITGDERFLILDGEGNKQSSKSDLAIVDEEMMEKFGFFQGPRVILSKKYPPRAEFFAEVVRRLRYAGTSLRDTISTLRRKNTALEANLKEKAESKQAKIK